jgi:transposase-like protein
MDRQLEGIHCPYCDKPMKLIMGNPAFTYWLCKDCKKEFEYNIYTEKITDEVRSDFE